MKKKQMAVHDPHRKQRATAARIIGQPESVIVSIDHVAHTLSVRSFKQLAADVLRVLQSLEREERPLLDGTRVCWKARRKD
jgi:hypothetical protein